jgi:hypothetical protein
MLLPHLHLLLTTLMASFALFGQRAHHLAYLGRSPGIPRLGLARPHWQIFPTTSNASIGFDGQQAHQRALRGCSSINANLGTPFPHSHEFIVPRTAAVGRDGDEGGAAATTLVGSLGGFRVSSVDSTAVLSLAFVDCDCGAGTSSSACEGVEISR